MVNINPIFEDLTKLNQETQTQDMNNINSSNLQPKTDKISVQPIVEQIIQPVSLVDDSEIKRYKKDEILISIFASISIIINVYNYINVVMTHHLLNSFIQFLYVLSVLISVGVFFRKDIFRKITVVLMALNLLLYGYLIYTMLNLAGIMIILSFKSLVLTIAVIELLIYISLSCFMFIYFKSDRIKNHFH